MHLSSPDVFNLDLNVCFGRDTLAKTWSSLQYKANSDNYKREEMLVRISTWIAEGW